MKVSVEPLSSLNCLLAFTVRVASVEVIGGAGDWGTQLGEGVYFRVGVHPHPSRCSSQLPQSHNWGETLLCLDSVPVNLLAVVLLFMTHPTSDISVASILPPLAMYRSVAPNKASLQHNSLGFAECPLSPTVSAQSLIALYIR